MGCAFLCNLWSNLVLTFGGLVVYNIPRGAAASARLDQKHPPDCRSGGHFPRAHGLSISYPSAHRATHPGARIFSRRRGPFTSLLVPCLLGWSRSPSSVTQITATGRLLINDLFCRAVRRYRGFHEFPRARRFSARTVYVRCTFIVMCSSGHH